jgi:hypothetical protein
LAPANKDLLVNPDLQANKALKENKESKDPLVIKDLRDRPGLLGLLVAADRVTVLPKDTLRGFYRSITRVDTSISTLVSNRKETNA